jgi:hypothetical protein
MGITTNIGNFIPTNSSYTGEKANVISSLIQDCGNFGWFITPFGIKTLWRAEEGDIVNLERQTIGRNLTIYQVLNHNINESSAANIVNKYKVIMGDDVVPGYNNEFRFAWVDQEYIQYNQEWIDKYRPEKGMFSENQRKYISSIQWLDRRTENDGEAYETYIQVPNVGNNFKITVPSGFKPGYPLKYEPGLILKCNWQGECNYITVPAFGISTEAGVLSENTEVSYSYGRWVDRGGIYPDARRERTFEITMGDYPTIIKKDLVLSDLNVQYGYNYTVYEGHNYSWYEEFCELPRITPDVDPGGPKKTTNRTWGSISSKSFKVPSWNDLTYATDIAKWKLSQTCDIKKAGSIQITMDCADFYNISLEKRINISGVTDQSLNIISIDYDVGSYTVTLTLESFRAYKRIVSIPVHGREK